MILYLFESKYLLYYYTNLLKIFSNKIKSNYICFNHI